MSASAIIYDATGKILRQVDAHEDALTMQAQQPGEFVLFGKANDQTQYIEQGAIIDRPVMAIATDKTAIFANGVDAVTFSNVPSGAHAVIQRIDEAAMLDAITKSIPIARVEGVITTGSDTFLTSIAGTYRATFSLWPHIDQEIIINAA